MNHQPILLWILSIIVFALPTAATQAARKMDRVALFWALWTAVGVGAYAVPVVLFIIGMCY